MEIQNSPYEPPLQQHGGVRPRVAESRIAINWLVFLIASTVASAIAGFLLGAIMGGVLGASGASIQTIQVVGGLAGFLVSLPISYLTFRWRVVALLRDVEA